MLNSSSLGRKTREYFDLLGFYVAILVLPGYPPDVVWASRHFNRPYWVSDGQFSSLRFLSFFLFHILLTATSIGLFLKFITTLPISRNPARDATEARKLDALSRVFGAWYCPVAIFLGIAAILLNLISITIAFSIVGKRHRHRLTRRLLRAICVIAVLQVVLGVAAVALSYPETWLRAQQDWQAWQDIPRLGVYVGGFEIALWFVLVYGLVRLVGAVVLLGTSIVFRPPLQYTPSVQETKTQHLSASPTSPSGQHVDDAEILAKLFNEQRRQVRLPSSEAASPGTSTQVVLNNSTAQHKKSKTPSMAFKSDTIYWTNIPISGFPRNGTPAGVTSQSGRLLDKGHQAATAFHSELGRGIAVIRKWSREARLVAVGGLLCISTPLFLLSAGTQIACFIVTRANSQECGWKCYALVVYPFFALPPFITVAYLVYRRVSPRSPARLPREFWIRCLLVLLVVLLVASQAFGIALSAQSGRIAVLGGDPSDSGDAQTVGLLFLIASGGLFLMCAGLSILCIWRV
ncbi:hypothetical protein B0T16DRAFT_496486 [Cercophora newfieldiana]|uniref:Uncharacterized protein n=1 Tax=Cercophora newfieldiana TaxID=92897 RepID=A0AA39XX41_9PEZI|nr:hypothetical protein B0T16DRAFT_496486 [Cercophora newfieldiana]